MLSEVEVSETDKQISKFFAGDGVPEQDLILMCMNLIATIRAKDEEIATLRKFGHSQVYALDELGKEINELEQASRGFLAAYNAHYTFEREDVSATANALYEAHKRLSEILGEGEKNGDK